ncbi:hypothetical protein PEPNEM18_01066 [Aedoeadaptatus nemausensis]|uniref:Uncharacterized protein n=1 Tax=Aedoeadaptatus nemausensis TaxID=2582829 RepID=A0A6V6Y4D8_9FIRM|nr:hypothetical protein [Peptoniphilus nemausensis]CAC9931739.1 hypothetical protein PEPNEM18_01066 [Peptoniphilus nemausensis]
MRRSDDPSTAELLSMRLEDLRRYNDQIELGEDAKKRKPALLEEIGELFDQFWEEEFHGAKH